MSNKRKLVALLVSLSLLVIAIGFVIGGALGSSATPGPKSAQVVKGAEGGKPLQAPTGTRLVVQTSTPLPTATNLPTATPSPKPAPTATPSPTPVPTATPLPTTTPVVELQPQKTAFSQRFNFRKTDVVRYLRPGVIQVQRQQPGPVVLNVLLFDLTAPELSLKVALQDDWLSGVARTSVLAKANDALAAVNGDLFSYNGLPQGMTMTDGKLALAPKRRATFAYSRNTGPFIGYFTQGFTWDSYVIGSNGERHSLEIMNSICKENWLCIYNDLYHNLPYGADDVKVTLNSNDEVLKITERSQLSITPGTQVLLGRGNAGKWLLQHARQGEKLELNLVTDPDYHQFEQIISGGPVFLRNGSFIQDCLCYLEDCSQTTQKAVLCEEFTTDWKLSHYLNVRMPRNGVGYNSDKSVLMVTVVDGYQPGHSIGMTQKEFANLFLEFGMDSAMELDGGGSATMWVDGKLASRPSDGSGFIERAVPNALIFQWNGGSGGSTTPPASSGYNSDTTKTTPSSTPTKKPK